MTIKTSLTNSAKKAFLKGQALTTDIYKLALYTDVADLDYKTARYTKTGEVKAQGYAVKTLKAPTLSEEGSVVTFGFSDTLVWPVSTITARGCMIYNSSKVDTAMFVLDFGSNISSTNDDFKITLPENLLNWG